MNKLFLCIFLFYCSLVNANEYTVDKELSKKYGCSECHSLDEKSSKGPAYIEIYAKYFEDPKAEDYLVDKVLKGSEGVWGKEPMKAVDIPAEDARKLVKTILEF